MQVNARLRLPRSMATLALLSVIAVYEQKAQPKLNQLNFDPTETWIWY